MLYWSSMLTPTDKKWIEEKFTKELKPVRDSVDLARQKLTTLSLERFDFDSRLNSIEASTIRTEEKIDKILNIVNKNLTLNLLFFASTYIVLVSRVRGFLIKCPQSISCPREDVRTNRLRRVSLRSLAVLMRSRIAPLFIRLLSNAAFARR